MLALGLIGTMKIYRKAVSLVVIFVTIVLVGILSILFYRIGLRRSLYRFCLTSAPSVEFSKDACVQWRNSLDGGVYYFYSNGYYVIDYPDSGKTIHFIPPQNCFYEFHHGELVRISFYENGLGRNRYRSYDIEENPYGPPLFSEAQ